MSTINEKKSFIRWFVEEYQLKRRECVWILNYLLHHDTILNKIRFIKKDASYCPRGIIMSTYCEEDASPFRYYKNGVMTTDPDRAFNDMRYDSDTEYYIQLNFSGINELRFVGIEEDNIYSPSYHEEQEQFNDEVEELLSHIERKVKRAKLMEQIDRALETGDRQAFYALSSRFNDLPIIKPAERKPEPLPLPW